MRLRASALTRPRLAVLVAVVLAVLAAVAIPAGAAVLPPGPTTTVRAPDPVDPYAAYVGQTTCDPTIKPGAQAVLRLAMDHYKIGRNTGITRACSVGGQSEHKEGRAFDWGLNVNNPAEKAAGDAFTHWLTAPGPDDKPGYNARRLGVMYVIWNTKIWTAYNAGNGWRPYYGASPHTDHVHVSLSWNGAHMRTSWWTGSLVAQKPIGVMEAVTPTGTDITVQGWALDPDTSNPTDVHVYVDGAGRSVRADRSRPDIAAAYGRGDKHGFSVTIPAAPGSHTVCAYAIDSSAGGNTPLDCRTVVVRDAAPVGAVDAVTTTTSSLTVSGWSLDPDTSAPNDVHVYVDGAGTAVRADRSRPDIGRIFGKGDQHGFTHTASVRPGRLEVCVYGMNTAPGANTPLGCRTVVVEPPATAPPVGALEAVTASSTGVTLSGWAVDPDTTASTSVHVYVDGVGVAVTADGRRPDVAAALGRGDRHGYTYTKALAPGAHTACVYAINTGAGGHTLLGCRNFTVVANRPPVGAVDAVVPGRGTISVSGWVLDPDTTEPTHAHVYVDSFGAAVRADGSRPDVAAAFAKGDRHGFTHVRTVAPGPHKVCVYGIDATGADHRLLNCRTVQVTG